MFCSLPSVKSLINLFQVSRFSSLLTSDCWVADESLSGVGIQFGSHFYVLSHSWTFFRCWDPVHWSLPSVVWSSECGQLQANPAWCPECDIQCDKEPRVCQWYCSIWCACTPVANPVQSSWCTDHNSWNSVCSHAYHQDRQGCFGKRWACTLTFPVLSHKHICVLSSLWTRCLVFQEPLRLGSSQWL